MQQGKNENKRAVSRLAPGFQSPFPRSLLLALSGKRTGQPAAPVNYALFRN